MQLHKPVNCLIEKGNLKQTGYNSKSRTSRPLLPNLPWSTISCFMQIAGLSLNALSQIKSSVHGGVGVRRVESKRKRLRLKKGTKRTIQGGLVPKFLKTQRQSQGLKSGKASNSLNCFTVPRFSPRLATPIHNKRTPIKVTKSSWLPDLQQIE